jgi:hypothetical protein
MINTLSLFENRDYYIQLCTELNFFLLIFYSIVMDEYYLYAPQPRKLAVINETSTIKNNI